MLISVRLEPTRVKSETTVVHCAYTKVMFMWTVVAIDGSRFKFSKGKKVISVVLGGIIID